VAKDAHVNNVQRTNELWLANKGEILKLPPQEQASMMQTFVALGTNIVAQNPVVKAEMEKLQAVVDAKRPK
jgi:TRAP-type transport system periplasmic protein